MKSKAEPKLSIFNTFKTKTSELTGEAVRQRSIIITLVNHTSPADKTRTAISQKIAKENNILWKNIYSGIFRDLDEILIPLNIVQEEGRLPLKRGPKALQEKGIPFYGLTQKGILIALSLDEISDKKDIMKQFFSMGSPEEKKFEGIFEKLIPVAPKFVYSIFEKYVRGYCKGKISDVIPLSFENLRKASDDDFQIYREILEGYASLPKSDKENVLGFLKKIST